MAGVGCYNAYARDSDESEGDLFGDETPKQDQKVGIDTSKVVVNNIERQGDSSSEEEPAEVEFKYSPKVEPI